MSYILQPEKWVTDYENYLLAYARSKLNNVFTARDIVQEAFLAAFKNRSLYKGNASEKAWLTAILKNKINDHYRRIYRLKEKGMQNTIPIGDFESGLIFEPTEDSHECNSISRYINFRELENSLKEASKILKGIQLKVFTLHSEGYSNEEICQELSISKSHCWVALHRVRRKLRAELRSEFYISLN